MHSVWRGKNELLVHECGKVFEIIQEQFSGENFTSFYPIEENRNLSVCPKCGKSLKTEDFSNIIEKEG